MEQYSELISKISALEVKIDLCEDINNKLLRLVVEGNGRPSMQSQQLVLQHEIDQLKSKISSQDSLIDSLLNRKIGKEEDVDEEENSKSKTTIILAIITSLSTIIGMAISTLPSVLPSLIDEPVSIDRPDESIIIKEDGRSTETEHYFNV